MALRTLKSVTLPVLKTVRQPWLPTLLLVQAMAWLGSLLGCACLPYSVRDKHDMLQHWRAFQWDLALDMEPGD